MNLYKIEFRHYGPKDNDEGIKEFCLFNNDEELFNYIDRNYALDRWTEGEDEWGNEDQTYKEFILKNKGDDEDESLFEDLYYGLTTYSWELVKENILDEDTNKLVELNIIKKEK